VSVDPVDVKVKQAAQSIAIGLTGLLIRTPRGDAPHIDEARAIFESGVRAVLDLMVMPKDPL